ncbi:phage tail protein [Lactococcus lactis subsp. lactis]|uniref:phage tail protein n=1 Tax=Lactococcus lactis TaxID=1358 RepID=UPI002A815FBC|nr:phage tail protein [Lactococcus lactis]MDY4362094.1 phage tail protein [Lactococcus lactis subsp. lactis]
MLINILDVNLQKVAFLSNDVPGLPSYYDDEFHEYRDQGAATFKFTVKKVINNKLQSYARFLNGQSYFSFQIDGNDYLMTPASEQAIHETSEEISFFCVSLDRELMSEQANPLVNTSSHNIQWYFDQMGLISNTQITIGINEVSNLTRTINYDGQETKLARLISVIGNFDAEFEFITKLNNDGSLGSVTLNIYKENDGLDIQGVGKKRDDVRLIFGENIQAVERDVSTEGFLNATTVTGADNLNWNSASFSYINADGVEEFYKRAGSDTAFAPLSAKIYPAQLSKEKDDIWTRIDFTTEYKNVNDMWAYAVRQFKQYAYHQVSYTVTPSSKLVNAEIGDGPPLAKGDTVIIQDNNYVDIDGNVGLLLSARVSEKIVSETHPENNKLIFSNYKKLKNEVSTDIQAIVNQLVDAATPYIGSINTTNGTQFKNGTGSTTLSAHIFKGSATTETIADSYEWSKDGTVVAPTQTITVDASGVADKAVYSFKATVAGKVVASQSVTITNVNDGTSGKTSYTHVAWANSADGTDGFTTVYPNLNLLSQNDLIPGYLNDKGVLIPPSTGVNERTSPFLEVDASQSYTAQVFVTLAIQRSSWCGISWFDQNQIFIKRTAFQESNVPISGNYTYHYTVQPPSNAKFVRISFRQWGDGKLKLEPGSTATPWMPSSSEVTTADWSSYIGQYSDFTATASTDPTKYAPWTVFKGIDGRGVVSSEQKYQLTQTSAKPVDAWDNSVWQTTQPTTTATNKYLWSITRTTFNLAPLTQDIVEQKAVYGNTGKDGDPGKVVSDTEPTTRFKGLTWKYSGASDLTASDGTVIKPNTEYYYNGTHWVINYFSVNNFAAESITSDKIDGKNLTITDGEFVSTTTNGPVTTSTEIKDNHIAISKTDGTVNTRNDIALDSEQGLAQKFTNIDTGFYRTAGINYQGPFTSDSDGNYAQLTPQGTKLSTDVPWTTLAATGGFSGGTIQFSVQNGVAYFSVSGLSVPAMTGNNWYQCAQLPTGSSAIPSVNRVTTAFGNASVWGFFVSSNGGLYFQSKTSVSATANLANALAAFPIG